MAGEFDPAAGDGEEDITTEVGGGEGSGTADSGQPGAGGGAGAEGAGAGRQTPPAERTFTQREINIIVGNRIAEERRRFEARAAAERQAGAGRPQGRENQPQNFDEPTKQALDAYLDAQLTPLREQAVKGEINTAFAEFREKHPEIGEKAVRDAVIEQILSWGEDFVQRTPMNWLLEQGYLAYKYGNFDEEKFFQERQARYLAEKAGTARKVPNAQGSGGKATTTPKPHGKEWKDADAVMRQLVDEENSARA
jgi:hypothetical protein